MLTITGESHAVSLCVDRLFKPPLTMKPTARSPNMPTSAALIRILIAIIAVLLTVIVEWRPGGAGADFANESIRDAFIKLHASNEPEKRIAVVDIDEESLAAIGPWPWSRQRIADLVEHLLGPYGARGVALDLVLPEPGDQEGDTRLSALAQHGPVVLAQAFDYVNRAQVLRVGQLAGSTMPAATLGAGSLATGYIANHHGLSAARHVGNIGFVPDGDAICRSPQNLTENLTQRCRWRCCVVVQRIHRRFRLRRDSSGFRIAGHGKASPLCRPLQYCERRLRKSSCAID
jgi:hypothetical protein